MLLQVRDPNSGLRAELHQQHRLFRPTGPQVDGVDRIGGILHADEAEGDFDVIRPDLAADDIENLFRELFGFLNPGASRSAHPQGKLPGIYDRKYFATKSAADNDDDKSS